MVEQFKDDGSNFESYDELFSYLNHCGFEAVDFNLAREGKLNLENYILSENWVEEAQKIKEDADKNHIEIYQTHLPFHEYSQNIDSVCEEEMKFFNKKMKICIEASKIMNA